jgi:hypothetical protein
MNFAYRETPFERGAYTLRICRSRRVGLLYSESSAQKTLTCCISVSGFGRSANSRFLWKCIWCCVMLAVSCLLLATELQPFSPYIFMFLVLLLPCSSLYFCFFYSALFLALPFIFLIFFFSSPELCTLFLSSPIPFKYQTFLSFMSWFRLYLFCQLFLFISHSLLPLYSRFLFSFPSNSLTYSLGLM